ncbi:MAG: hypothetical protein MZW92_20505 [Comamonadaceae bacterium]|nr:hypothetical protein [Comamonadaceae bacterium]
MHDLRGACPRPGGMLRYGIPEYRLPRGRRSTARSARSSTLGVELPTNVAPGRGLHRSTSLQAQGFDAVFLALGAWDSHDDAASRTRTRRGVLPGHRLPRRASACDEPADARPAASSWSAAATPPSTAARTALRLGRRRGHHPLPPHPQARCPPTTSRSTRPSDEGVKHRAPGRARRVVVERDGRVAGLECMRMELGEPDACGRRSPMPVRGLRVRGRRATSVIAAIGQSTTARARRRQACPTACRSARRST